MAPIVSSVLRIIRASVPCQTSALSPMSDWSPIGVSHGRLWESNRKDLCRKVPATVAALFLEQLWRDAAIPHLDDAIEWELAVSEREVSDVVRRDAVVAGHPQLIERQLGIAKGRERLHVLGRNAMVASGPELLDRELVAEIAHVLHVVSRHAVVAGV